MAKINEIDITSLTFQEGSAPATPASTKWKVYTKTDGIYVIDDAGTETGPLGAGGGGSAATVLVDSGSVGSGGSFTLTGIATGYEYLELFVTARTDRAGQASDGLLLQMGDGSIDTGSNYSYHTNFNGSASGNVTSVSHTNIRTNIGAAGGSSPAAERGAMRYQIFNYDDAALQTQVLFRCQFIGSTQAISATGGGAYRVTNVVDQLKVSAETGPNFTGGEYWLIGVL